MESASALELNTLDYTEELMNFENIVQLNTNHHKNISENCSKLARGTFFFYNTSQHCLLLNWHKGLNFRIVSGNYCYDGTDRRRQNSMKLKLFPT